MDRRRLRLAEVGESHFRVRANVSKARLLVGIDSVFVVSHHQAAANDHVDLIQFHEIIRQVRYIGFTGHRDPTIHSYMLKVAEGRKFVFDSVQMPVNVIDHNYRSLCPV